MSNKPYNYNGEDIIREMKTLLSEVKIKLNYEAKKYETADSARMGEMYCSAFNHETSVYTYDVIDNQVLLDYGFTQNEIDNKKLYEPSNIPSTILRDVLDIQDNYFTAWYLDNDVESNDYYRRLNGKPGAKDEILFAPPEFYTKFGIDLKPVHQFNDIEVTFLNREGYLDDLIEKHPDLDYLTNLGDSRVTYDISRTALPFELIRLRKKSLKIHEMFIDRFIELYNTIREYFMTAIFNKSMANSYEYYENFIGMAILIDTINNMVVYNIKSIINRELYDLSTIRLLYSAYNLPFVQALPLETHQNIINNINYLLQYKSTNKVLLHLLDIFDYSDISINKYFLIKKHKKDEYGNPIFVYKTVKDENGKEVKVLDKEQMYELSFQLVDIASENIASDINNNVAYESYSTVTTEDPYWIEDEKLKDTLYNNTFNYIETKYLGLTSMYISTKKTFDITYGIRLLEDTNSYFKSIPIKINRLFGDTTFSILETVSLLNALLAKKNKLKSSIFFDPPQVATIRGFDFKKDLSIIIQDIDKNPNLDNTILVPLLNKIQTTGGTIEEIQSSFDGVMELYRTIRREMTKTTKIEVYYAYKELYNTLLICKENLDTFTDDDGNRYNTYNDYLTAVQPKMAAYLTTVSDDEITEDITYVIKELEKILPKFTNLRILNKTDTVLYNTLLQFIIYFKSYTTDVINFASIVTFNDNMEHMVKIIDKLHSKDVYGLTVNEYLDSWYDTISGIESEKERRDAFKVFDTITNAKGVDSLLYYFDDTEISDKLFIENDLYYQDGRIDIYDSIQKQVINYIISSKTCIKDELYSITEWE